MSDDGSGILEIVSSAITAAGVVYAALQFRLAARQHKAAEQWKRMEFASQLVERISQDEELAFCARALDWGVGPLIIPTKYRVLFPTGQTTIKHDWNKLSRAVQPHLDPGGLEPELLVYRYCFDTFGAYLETIARHVELGSVKKEHLLGIGYFLSILVEADYYRILPAHLKLPRIDERSVFSGFFKAFYPEALSLLTNADSFPGARAPTRVDNSGSN